MKTSKQWTQILLICSAALLAVAGTESRAQDADATQEAVVVRAAVAGCIERSGAYSEATAKCLSESLTTNQLDACLNSESVANGCSGADPVLISWIRMERDVAVFQRGRIVRATSVASR